MTNKYFPKIEPLQQDIFCIKDLQVGGHGPLPPTQKHFICGSATWVFGHKKIVICFFFFENGGDDKNDNHILVGNKLSVACSESIKCRGLTIFENEAVKAKTRPSFYSKILR